jgi:hypothetical protein
LLSQRLRDHATQARRDSIPDQLLPLRSGSCKSEFVLEGLDASAFTKREISMLA